MPKRFTKKILALLAVLLLTPWPAAYAYDNAPAGERPVQITAAEPSAAPSLSVFGKAIGGVTTPGDLFCIDTADSPVDMLVTLHLTNAEELIHFYRYLMFNVGIYIQTDTNQWQKATASDGELVPDTYLTMQNGRVSFMLPGYAKYKVTIDNGSFNCFRSDADGCSISPKFYLTAE